MADSPTCSIFIALSAFGNTTMRQPITARVKIAICLQILFVSLAFSSCSLDYNCTLQGRPSVCFVFQDQNGSPAFPDQIAYQIKTPQYLALGFPYYGRLEQLKALLDFESDRQESKADLLKEDGEYISSIAIGAALHEKQMWLCINNSIIGTYMFQFKWKEKTIQQVVEVKGDRCGPLREERVLVLPFAYCDEELRSKYTKGELQDFVSCQ